MNVVVLYGAVMVSIGNIQTAGTQHIRLKIGFAASPPPSPTRHLAPLTLTERGGQIGPVANKTGGRCSDKGFLPMDEDAYLQLLTWTATHVCKKANSSTKRPRLRTPAACQPVLEQMNLDARRWLLLVTRFGRLFYNVAGAPQTIDLVRSRVARHRYNLRSETRELFGS